MNTEPQKELAGWEMVLGRAWVVLGVVFVGSVVGVASVGEGGPVSARVVTVVEILIYSGWMPVVYVLGAWGYGRVLWQREGEMAWVGRLGVGLAVMLSATHLMGVFGILNGMSAWAVSGVGVLLAGYWVVKDHGGEERGLPKIDGLGLCFGVVVAGVVGLLVVAACQPAGVLWDSEYGNYDSLSYHLELPRVWMEMGRVWPVDFNVYSFLPSYVEAAYVHMGALGGTGMGGLGLADDGGRGIYAAQLLSVVFTVLGALVSGSVTNRACVLLGMHEGVRDIGGWIARVLVVTTPWVVVVGTISYNESAVVLLTMCGIGIALETQWSVMRRTVGAAVVMGVACSCKPTALFLAVPMVGVVLLSLVPVKVWWKVVIVGGVVGAVVLMPWLVRNEMAAGNPVFPMMSSVFGEGHWDSGQHERYGAAHSFGGNWIERMKMLVMPDAGGTAHVSRYRGLSNMQWGVTPAMGMVGLIVLVGIQKTRRAGVVCVVGVGVVLVAWMGLTHLQSRFLVPMVGVLGVLGGLGVVAVGDWGARQRGQAGRPGGARYVAGIVVLITATMGVIVVPAILLVVQVGGQVGGSLNGFLVVGTDAFAGEIGEGGFDEVLWWGGVNRVAEDGAGVYLIGDATASYVRSPVMYNTTYDGWLIGDLMRQFPEDHGAWERGLRERGIGWIVVNLRELDRLGESGWGDPDVTADSMIEWVGSLGEPAAVWGRRGRAMIKIGVESSVESSAE